MASALGTAMCCYGINRVTFSRCETEVAGKWVPRKRKGQCDPRLTGAKRLREALFYQCSEGVGDRSWVPCLLMSRDWGDSVSPPEVWEPSLPGDTDEAHTAGACAGTTRTARAGCWGMTHDPRCANAKADVPVGDTPGS